MKEVSEFEARLLRILRVIMGRGSIDQVLTWLVRTIRRPSCLSADGIALAEEYLARGMTGFLARAGWTSDRFQSPDQVVAGRLWERHTTDTMALTFSASSMELLIWLTSENVVQPAHSLEIDTDALTVGDRLLFARTYLVIQDTLGGPTLGQQPGFADNALVSLMAPWNAGLQSAGSEPDIDFWCQPARAWILEALQPLLADAWQQAEQKKREWSNHLDIRKVGELQADVLQRLFSAAEASNRKDLCGFLLRAAATLLRDAEPATWFTRLDVQSLKMAARKDVYRAALAFFTGLEQLQRWTEQARNTSFYDEDYQNSQLWKARWEEWNGHTLLLQAREIARYVDPVKVITGSAL